MKVRELIFKANSNHCNNFCLSFESFASERMKVRPNQLDPVLELLCTELVEELASQPYRSSSISASCIEAAAGNLGWPDIGIDISREEGLETCSGEELLRISMAPLAVEQSCLSLSIFTHSGSEWKSSDESASSKEDKAQDFLNISSLPDGLREFIAQLKCIYSNKETDTKITKTEAVEALSKSQHLVIIFPLIIRFAVCEIRKRSRTSENVSDLVDLLEAVVSNPAYSVSYQVEFDVVLTCLLDLMMDPNMMRFETDEELKQSVRKRAAEIIVSFLRNKIGVFHSTKLVHEIIENVLIPYMEEIAGEKSISDPLLWSGLAGAVHATSLFIHEFLGITLPVHSSKTVKLLTRLLTKGESVSPASVRIIRQCL